MQPDPHTFQVQQLFIRHQQVVLGYVLSREPNFADAQDIVQEVFMTISKKADTWTLGTDFLAWVCTVARYEVLHFQRTRARRNARLEQDVLELIDIENEMDIAMFQQRVAALQNCLEKLAPRARELVIRRYHQSEMPEQIAPEVGWTVNSVRVALTRARQFLRDCMKQQTTINELI